MPDDKPPAKVPPTPYSHPIVQQMLGDSQHPGGLDLTADVVRQAGIAEGQYVLDAGCGRGTSAIYLARKLGCRVLGITLEPAGIAAAREQARKQGVAARTEFQQADLMTFPLPVAAFDAVLMECVLSGLPEKDVALGRLRAALRPGGRLLLADITFDGPPPPGLMRLLAMVGATALYTLAQYTDAAKTQGYIPDVTRDLPGAMLSLLKSISGKLKMAEMAASLGIMSMDKAVLADAKRVLALAQDLAVSGRLSYGLVLARA